jgi:hypothetical protein
MVALSLSRTLSRSLSISLSLSLALALSLSIYLSRSLSSRVQGSGTARAWGSVDMASMVVGSMVVGGANAKGTAPPYVPTVLPTVGPMEETAGWARACRQCWHG